METRSKTKAMASSNTENHDTNNVSLGIQPSSPNRGDVDVDHGDHARSGAHAVTGGIDASDRDAAAGGDVSAAARAADRAPGSPHYCN